MNLEYLAGRYGSCRVPVWTPYAACSRLPRRHEHVALIWLRRVRVVVPQVVVSPHEETDAAGNADAQRVEMPFGTPVHLVWWVWVALPINLPAAVACFASGVHTLRMAHLQPPPRWRRPL